MSARKQTPDSANGAAGHSLASPAGSECLPMWNNKGQVIHVPKNATIKDLLEMGVKDIRFGKPDEPIEDGWWSSQNTSS